MVDVLATIRTELVASGHPYSPPPSPRARLGSGSAPASSVASAAISVSASGSPRGSPRTSPKQAPRSLGAAARGTTGSVSQSPPPPAPVGTQLSADAGP